MPDEQRLQYPLGPNSLVLDVGAFRGEFMRWCLERWGCTVFAFEPVPEFYETARRSLAEVANPAGVVRLLPYGLGAKTARLAFALGEDGSSFHRVLPRMIDAEIRDVVEVFKVLNIGNVDLLKVNIEGSEYDLLDRMLDTGLIKQVRYLQVQFHSLIPDWEKRRSAIRARLAETHDEQWCLGALIWESWELKR